MKRVSCRPGRRLGSARREGSFGLVFGLAEPEGPVEADRLVVRIGHHHRSTFAGFDIHPSSIEAAREAAVQAGVDHRTRFEVAGAADLPGQGYDLACVFHTLHEMGDPVVAARRIRQALAGDGTLLLVEPYAGDALEDSLSLIGRGFYALPAVVQPPGSRGQDSGPDVNAQSGESALMSVLGDAGFSQFRRVALTPMSVVLEAKP